MDDKRKIIVIGNKDCPRLLAKRLVGLVEALVLLPGRKLQANDNKKAIDMDTTKSERLSIRDLLISYHGWLETKNPEEVSESVDLFMSHFPIPDVVKDDRAIANAPDK